VADSFAVTSDAVPADTVRLRSPHEGGHYESFFQRANHPHRPLAFWIRYTLLVPAGDADSAVGEVWATFFDGERAQVTAVKERRRLAECELSSERLGLRIGGSSLEEGSLRGTVNHGAHRIGWALDYEAPEPPLLLLPARYYEGGFPKAKSLVGAPRARFSGALEVDGRSIDVGGWIGSHNHNWGERHTERYAWGQVAEFDGGEDAFLECASARVRVGPVLLPFMTVVVLRLDGEEHRLNGLWTAARARTRVAALDWRFRTASRGVRVEAHIHAPASTFVGLGYDDPPGGRKLCLNSKLASCALRVEQQGQPVRELKSAHGCAFELLGFPAHPDIPLAL
jgi:hypothetical protein